MSAIVLQFRVTGSKNAPNMLRKRYEFSERILGVAFMRLEVRFDRAKRFDRQNESRKTAIERHLLSSGAHSRGWSSYGFVSFVSGSRFSPLFPAALFALVSQVWAWLAPASSRRGM
jgi:hypothetical protein